MLRLSRRCVLLSSDRLRPGDIEAWRAASAMDSVRPIRRQADEARRAIAAFLLSGRAAVAVSWGKDSVTVAHLVRGLDPSIPLYWVRLPGADNPDCERVRDAYLSDWPTPYEEFEAPAPERGADGAVVTGARSDGYAIAADRHPRRFTGIRADESGERARSAAVHGISTENVCRPILRWTALDVLAYLAQHDLPVHPVYAMSMGGQLVRERLRVASIGGLRGRGAGRLEWERTYYPELAP